MEGGAVIQAVEMEGEGETARFENACLQVPGWTISSRLITVSGDRVSAENAHLQGAGVYGSVRSVSGTPQSVALSGLRLQF
ncbi:MAG TPA: hypothetical protein VNT60_11475, partial [Deinococcales bacterium]|nr:hypothetical protein [Deinococcales bacterium]